MEHVAAKFRDRIVSVGTRRLPRLICRDVFGAPVCIGDFSVPVGACLRYSFSLDR